MPSAKKTVEVVLPLKTNNQPQTQTLPEGTADGNMGTIYFQGLCEGTTAAQVVRCNHLLGHVPRCGGESGCPEGEGCRRTKQILSHHHNCRRRRDRVGGCNICNQLMALCRIHSERCQAAKGSCGVLYCKNMKLNEVPNHSRIQLQLKASTEEQTSVELQQMMKKLLESVDPLTKQLTLRKFKHLFETNHQAAVQLLQFICAKKHKPQPVSPSYEMKNQTISKQLQTRPRNKPSPRSFKSNILPQASNRMLKLDVLVKGPINLIPKEYVHRES